MLVELTVCAVRTAQVAASILNTFGAPSWFFFFSDGTAFVIQELDLIFSLSSRHDLGSSFPSSRSHLFIQVNLRWRIVTPHFVVVDDNGVTMTLASLSRTTELKRAGLVPVSVSARNVLFPWPQPPSAIPTLLTRRNHAAVSLGNRFTG